MEHRHSPPSATKANFTGCFVALGVVFLLAIVGVIAVFGFFRVASKDAHLDLAETQEAIIDHTVKIDKTNLSSYSSSDFGETVSEEHFVAVAVVDDMTTYGKKLFAEEANGLRVEWMLRVSDIKNSSNETGIEGQFEMPYRIRDGRSTSGSSVRVNAKFPPILAHQLVSLRKGEWVKLSGEIKFSSPGKSVTFENAQIVVEHEPDVLEPPSE